MTTVTNIGKLVKNESYEYTKRLDIRKFTFCHYRLFENINKLHINRV